MELIRIAADKDGEAIRSIYAPFCLPDEIASFELVPPSCDEMRTRISTVLAKYPWLVYEVDGNVLGYASAHQYHARAAYDWSVSVSIYLHEAARGLGVGKKLYTKLFEILRLQGFYNAYAGITIPNAASVALHKSMGFVEVGLTPLVGFKAEQWLAVALLWLDLQSHVPKPEMPRSFPEVRDHLDLRIT